MRTLLLSVILLSACAHTAETTPTPPAAVPMAKPQGIPAPADVAAPPHNAVVTPSGLATAVLQLGRGSRRPGPDDRVRVHYTGWTADGAFIDSSYKRGQPSTFPLNAVIEGWQEGLQLMVAGEKRRLWIPAELAYGDAPGKPQGMLVFDVELVEIITAPTAPVWLERPDPQAVFSPTGLASLVLRPGIGAHHPGPDSTVVVHYTGWTAADGMFDSSLMRGQPATFPLDRVIPGFSEGIQLMVIGEQRRIWVPEELGYEGRPGRPQGVMVYDIELIDIE